MAALVLFASSLCALILLILHSLRRRGGKVTAAFFISGTVFGVIRGNTIYLVCQHLSGISGTPYLPQEKLLPHLGHESIQVVIGWMFAVYLAWTLSEYVLRRLKQEDRLFPTVGLAALFMACISYCMETTATHVGWWYWALSMNNPVFGEVPPAGIAAWFSIATDFLFPFLFIVCSQYRKSPWRWLTLLVFPVHMVTHALYGTFTYIDNMHILMILLVAGLALFNRTRIETGGVPKRTEGKRGWVDFIPAIAVTTFLVVILRADLLVVGDFTLALTAIPLVIFALLAVPRIPPWVVVIVALPGLAAWPWVGYRATYALVPLVALAVFFSLGRVKAVRKAALAWMMLTVVLTGLIVTRDEIERYRMTQYMRLMIGARYARAQGREPLARDLREQALQMEFNTPGALWWSIRHLIMFSADDLEFAIPEARRRYARLIPMDPRPTGPYIEWAGWLCADGEIAEATEKCRSAVALEPTMASHHAFLGYLLLRDGRLDAARDALTEAIALGGEDAETRINLALVLALQGDTEEAEKLLVDVLAKDPTHPVATLNMEHLKKSPARLRADLAHIAAPDKYAFLGAYTADKSDRKVAAGDLPAAVKLMELTVHFTPRSAMYRSNYASLLSKTGGSLEEAVNQCEQAVRLDDRLDVARRNMVKLSTTLAREQVQRGDTRAARATLGRALPYASGDPRRRIERMLQDLGPAQP